jgi:acyl-CoA dehydrogenase
LHASGTHERRYVLFNAVQKAKVSTEGVKVLGLLSECIGARGVESQTYFESAVRDAQLIPGLEGSTHINFAQTAQFIGAYFAPFADGAQAAEPVRPVPEECDENPYWMQAHDRNAKTVRFAHFRKAYRPLQALPNVGSFVEQVEALRLFVADGVAALHPTADTGLVIEIGKCFSTIVYAQLVAENCLTAAVEPATVSLIFHGLIEDLSAQSLKLSAMFAPGGAERDLLNAVVRVPNTSATDFLSVSELIAARYGSRPATKPAPAPPEPPTQPNPA